MFNCIVYRKLKQNPFHLTNLINFPLPPFSTLPHTHTPPGGWRRFSPTPRYQCLCVCGGLSKACDCVSKPHAHSHNARAKKNAPLRFFFFFSPVVVFFFFLTFFLSIFAAAGMRFFALGEKIEGKAFFTTG